MQSSSPTISRLLPLALVLVAHGVLLAMLLRGTTPVPALVTADAMQVDLLLPEPQAPPIPQRLPPPLVRQPTPPVPATPVAPVPVSNAPSPIVVPPPPSVHAEAPPAPVPTPTPQPPAPAPIALAETVIIPPRVDASWAGNTKPAYPTLSKRLDEQGTVILSIYVLADGTTGSVTLKKSSGYRRLDDAAIKAVQTWKFTPARRGGQPIAASYLLPMPFSLTDAH